jgi:WD domain, G-beta repeat
LGADHVAGDGGKVDAVDPISPLVLAGFNLVGNLYTAHQGRVEEHRQALEQQTLQQLHQQELTRLTAELQRDTAHQAMLDRIELDTYPVEEGPGNLRKGLELTYADLADAELVVLLAPITDQAQQSPWVGLNPFRELSRYAHIYLYEATRRVRWPNANLYWGDLYGLATLLIQVGLDQQILDLRLGGCHLLPGPGAPITPLRTVLTLAWPAADTWTPERVAALNGRRPAAAALGPPVDEHTLAALNRELAVRLVTLLVVQAIDAFHIITTPGYQQQVDSAAAAVAGVADTDWPVDLGVAPERAADPPLHLLHIAERHAYRAQPEMARQAILDAVVWLNEGNRLLAVRTLMDRIPEPYRQQMRRVLAALDEPNLPPAVVQALDAPRRSPEPVPASPGVLTAPAASPAAPTALTRDSPVTRAAPAPIDRSPGTRLLELFHDKPVTAVAFSPDGARLATASEDGTARMWDAVTGTQLHQISHNWRVTAVAFSPDAARLATASGKTARIWDAATGRQLLRVTGGTISSSTLSSVEFSSSGRRLVTLTKDKMADIFDAATGERLLQRLVWGSDGNVSVAFRPDGSVRWAYGRGRTARIWDVINDKQLRQVHHDDDVRVVAFSPDGARLATGSRDRTARIWDTATGRQLLQLQHGEAVQLVAFSPDGARLATTSKDDTTRIWDAATGTQLLQIRHDTKVSSMAFSPDGTRLATATGKTARIWAAS